MAKLKTLSFEHYHLFFNNPLISSSFNFDQLNHILYIHGFYRLTCRNRRKEMILEALDAIHEFINPHRSTLNETQISTNNDVCLSIDQVTADLDALQWHDSDDDDDNKDDNVGGNMEIVEYKRKRKEFNPVHLKKPRSKIKTHKRNNIKTDFETMEKLEKDCAVGYNKNASIFCDMMDDPLCRIRFYSVHIMLVAEINMAKLGELVGVVRGCIKEVGFGLRRSNLKMGYILGLRVSPRHWHMGIGLILMNAIEEWLAKNGAECQSI